MSRKVVVFEADDGSRWDDEAKARQRDALVAEVEAAMLPLGRRYDDGRCDFANGGGYVQHAAAAVVEARANLLVPTRRILASWFADQLKRHGKDPSDADPSWFRRMLDGGSGPLDAAWARFACIDAQGREWGQSYFAAHPEEAKQTAITVPK